MKSLTSSKTEEQSDETLILKTISSMPSPVKVKPQDDIKDVTNGVIQDVKELSNVEDIDYKFATETSLHGVGLIATAKNLLVKIIWTLIVLCMCGVLIWQIVQLLINFFKYAPVTEVRIEVSWSRLSLKNLKKK